MSFGWYRDSGRHALSRLIARRYSRALSSSTLLPPRLATFLEKLPTAESTDVKKQVELAKQRKNLLPASHAYQRVRQLQEELGEIEHILSDTTQSALHGMAREEQSETLDQLAEAEESVIRAFLPQDEADSVTTALVEIRAGAGGEEASLFVVDMARLYEQFVARQPDWRLKTISWTEDFSQPKGAKEVVLQVTGADVYRLLKYESGVHRVQRVPATETQGRVHTSTVTVAVLPQYDQVDFVLAEKDLKYEACRASGAGGQHVNTTDSAVRVYHLPTNTVVFVQTERSQHQNRSLAIKILRAKLYEQARLQKQASQREARRSLIGTADRSEKIRTYNFPQSRVTDHRIKKTIHQLEAVMSGQLAPFLDELKKEEHQRAIEDHLNTVMTL